MSRHILLALVIGACAAGSASAQSLSFTGAGNGSSRTVAAGPDFAATVVGDPWDFAQESDYVWMYSDGWASRPTVADGRLVGTVSASAADAAPSLQIQFEGITGALNVVGKNGVVYPIDPTRYNRLSFRMRRSVRPNPEYGRSRNRESSPSKAAAPC